MWLMVILRVTKIWDFIRYLEGIFLIKNHKVGIQTEPNSTFFRVNFEGKWKIKKLLQHDLSGAKYWINVSV